MIVYCIPVIGYWEIDSTYIITDSIVKPSSKVGYSTYCFRAVKRL